MAEFRLVVGGDHHHPGVRIGPAERPRGDKTAQAGEAHVHGDEVGCEIAGDAKGFLGAGALAHGIVGQLGELADHRADPGMVIYN